MSVREITAKSILTKHKKVDSWFVASYGMNLYRGCTHNCSYCDGRAEGYYVSGDFGTDIEVKINAIDLLKKALDPKRRRTPLKSGFVMVGGGVCDSYQPVEKRYALTRSALQILCDHGLPVHMLTKSCLIERDMDLLTQINARRKAVVSMSFSSTDERLSSLFEPGVPSPERRLKTLARFKENGITTGMFLMPVLPFLTDTAELMERALSDAKRTGVDFIVFSGMTLKEGRQSEHFYSVLNRHFPGLAARYAEIYRGNRWGAATDEYYHAIQQTFRACAKKVHLPVRMPFRIYGDILTGNDLSVVILEQIDYCLKLENRKSPFGWAAYNISQLKEPLPTQMDDLRRIKGVTAPVAEVLLQILNTGRSDTLDELMSDYD